MKDIIITPQNLKDWNACSDGQEWGLKIIGVGMPLVKLLAKFDRADWLLWTLRKSEALTKVQYVELAIICAKTVLSIYEKKYPKDERPRKAIESTIRYVKYPTEENRKTAAAAAADAYAAAAAADAAADAAAYAAAAAADAAAAAAADAAAYAAADAADAAAYAAAYAAYAAAAARKKNHKKMCKLLSAQIRKWIK